MAILPLPMSVWERGRETFTLGFGWPHKQSQVCERLSFITRACREAREKERQAEVGGISSFS